MERVAFLVEPGGQQISCLLNPEGLTIRRAAGLAPSRAQGGAIAGRGLADDALLFTGGGATELEVDLLFDLDLLSSTTPPLDVRDLTGPLWRLSENISPEGSYGAPPTVRFIWGKAWNMPAVVTAAAERFERFTPEGIPRRSWLRLRLERVPDESQAPVPLTPPDAPPVAPDLLDPDPAPLDQPGRTHTTLGGGEPDAPTERVDEIARRYYGDASLWRLIAVANDLPDPLDLRGGAPLQVPGTGVGGAAS